MRLSASRLVALAFSVAAAACARADVVSVQALADALRTGTPEAASAQVCSDAAGNANGLNAATLFYGAWHCFGLNRNIDGTVLLLVAQARSTADTVAFPPRTDEDRQTMASLYGIVFYRLGGAGVPELYRDPTSRSAVLDRLLEWHGEVPEGYDPGWESVAAPSPGDYWAIARPVLIGRHKQVSDYAAVISDDRYYAAELELRELRKRNPRGFAAGTPDGDRATELLSIMDRMFEEQANRSAPPRR